MANILFEDHTLLRLRPLSTSVPTYEIRCGLFNTRERLEIIDSGQGGLLLCRPELVDLHTAPGWHCEQNQPNERTLWLNGRLGPDAQLLTALHEQRAEDWALQDEEGLLAASLSSELTATMLASWQKWQDSATSWNIPEQVATLPAPINITISELGFIWDLVPATAAAISADLQLVKDEQSFARHPFGVFSETEAPWSKAGSLRFVSAHTPPSEVTVSGSHGLFLGSGGVDIAPGVHLDTEAGPIVLDSGVRVMPHCYLAGPLYVGRDGLIKPGARIFGESSFGIGCRLAGEIGESTFGDFSNKQHEGFIGHAVLGSWVNLGAMTTCSDLKNNYGSVRVDLGGGDQDTGQRFVGLMLGDHVKIGRAHV